MQERCVSILLLNNGNYYHRNLFFIYCEFKFELLWEKIFQLQQYYFSTIRKNVKCNCIIIGSNNFEPYLPCISNATRAQSYWNRLFYNSLKYIRVLRNTWMVPISYMVVDKLIKSWRSIFGVGIQKQFQGIIFNMCLCHHFICYSFIATMFLFFLVKKK